MKKKKKLSKTLLYIILVLFVLLVIVTVLYFSFPEQAAHVIEQVSSDMTTKTITEGGGGRI